MDSRLKVALENWEKQLNYYSIENQKLLECVRTDINNKYKNNPCWYKGYKLSSEVYALIYKEKNILERTGITVDTAILTLCSLVNFTKTKTYFRVPDKYLTKRNQLSKKQLYRLLFILKRTGLITIKYNYNDICIKINYTYIKNDKYFNIKREKFLPKDKYIMCECETDTHTVYYTPYHKDTIRKHKKFLTLGVIYYYNKLYKEQILTPGRQQYIELYGEREDINYMEVPTELLSKILRVKRTDVLKYVYMLCKNTTYISKHNKCYIDNEKYKHFYNIAYNNVCELKTYKKVKLEENQQPITENSIILFPDEFNGSKIGKEILLKQNELENLIIDTLEFLQYDEDFCNINETTTNIINDNFSKTDTIKFNEFGFFEDEKLKCNIVDLTKLKQSTPKTDTTFKLRIPDEKIKTLSFNNTCSYIEKVLKQLTICTDRELTYFLNKYTKLECRIKGFINNIIITKADRTKYINKLEDYNLFQFITLFNN